MNVAVRLLNSKLYESTETMTGWTFTSLKVILSSTVKVILHVRFMQEFDPKADYPELSVRSVYFAMKRGRCSPVQ